MKTYYTNNNADIQTFLFSKGYTWNTGEKAVSCTHAEAIRLDNDHKTFMHASLSFYKDREASDGFSFISNDDLMKLLNGEAKVAIPEAPKLARPMCISISSKEVGQAIWNYLLSKGFKECKPFQMKERGYNAYIWINVARYTGLVCADNTYDETTVDQLKGDTEFAKIVEKCSAPVKIAPPEKITKNVAGLEFVINSNGLARCERYHPFVLSIEDMKTLLAYSDAHKKAWDEYNKK